MLKPILIIDPGHGGNDSGGGSNGYFKEKELNLKISLYQYERFKALGVPIVLTREKDIYLSPSNRTTIVRESGAKYCISNHINAAASSAAKGVETIHSIFSDGKIATAFYEAIIDAGMSERRVFQKASNTYPGKDYYYMHRDTGAVNTTIIEYGFATNSEDAKLLNDNWKVFAESVVRTFCEFTGYKYTNSNTSNSSENEQIELPNSDETLPQILKSTNITFEGKKVAGYINSNNKSLVEVRKLSEMVGLYVKWNGTTNTVELSKK